MKQDIFHENLGGDVPVCREDVAELATLINLTCSTQHYVSLYDPHLSHLHPLTPQTPFRDSKKSILAK